MNPKHEYEVYTSTNKDQRDTLFLALRASSDPFERQAVKFSGVEPVLGEAGTQEGRFVFYDRRRIQPQWRPLFRSTWSVAHPKAENF